MMLRNVEYVYKKTHVKYPCKNPYVKCYRMEDKPDRILMIDELTESGCDISIDLAEIYLQLDGKTDPYSLIEEEYHQDLSESLEQLNKFGMFKKRVYRVDHLEWIFPVIWLNDKKFALPFFQVADKLIRWVAIPTLVIGLLTLKDALFISYCPYSDSQIIWGTIVGYLAGILLHELSHFVSAVAAETEVIEMGLILSFIPGAYVAYDHEKIKSRKRKIYTYAAGILMNFFFAGICFLLSRVAFFTFFLITGFVNTILGATNMICAFSLDGMHILRALLGKSFEKILDTYKFPEKQQLIMTKKLNGCALLFAQGLFLLFKISMFVLVTSNIIYVASLILK